MKRVFYLTLAVLAAATASLPVPLHAQKKGALPEWVDQKWRDANYPQNDWYVGFSHDALKKNMNAVEAQKRVEREAQSRMAEGITVRIDATSVAQTRSSQVSGASGKVNETVEKEYGQIIEASTSAEIVRAQLHSHYDKSKNTVYAFAAVKKTDLAAYYRQRVEHYHQTAANNLAQAKQLSGLDRKSGALGKLVEAKNNIAESHVHLDLLAIVDNSGRFAKPLSDKGASMMKEITAMETQLREAGSIFVRSGETLLGEPTQRLANALKSKFSENNCRVANDPDDAGYILEMTVNDCNVNQSASFHYCSACITADLISAASGKSEAKFSVTGNKIGWTNAQTACEKAFDQAVADMWKSIREKTEVCK